MANALDGYLSRVGDYGRSFSVAVSEHGRPVLVKAYGPGLTSDSVFGVASVAKQFTAVAILKLAAERRLSFQDPVSRFFPDAPTTRGDRRPVAQPYGRDRGRLLAVSALAGVRAGRVPAPGAGAPSR
jgi:CubicO group peptidase (beta-lactamase class C family)